MVKRAAVYTLGCKVNQHEGEAIKQLFRDAGYEIVPFNECADVYVIHTCTVTHLGDRKSRQMIRRAVRRNEEAIVAVTGCYAQTSPGEILDIDGVDLVIGTKERNRIVELVEQARKGVGVSRVHPRKEINEFEDLPFTETSTVRAFLKIQEGCDQFCTYCIVPYARGPVRSRPLAETVAAVKQLVRRGYKEIVLTGIHIGAYGRDTGEYDLNTLLQELVKVAGLQRLRVSSVDPNEITPDLLETLTRESLICPHYHIPLQSGSDTVLKAMRRPYDTEFYRRLVRDIRAVRPQAAITTDVMVGFPGETDEQFQETAAFIEEIGFADLHVFKYSPRKGTPAARFPNQVDARVKEVRSKTIIELGKKLWRQYAEQFVEQSVEVLVEQESDDGWREGHTGNYLKVRFQDDEEKLRGELVTVIPYGVNDGYLLARRKTLYVKR
ncbi:MAG: tRNA (N(6)-L-threonylcarbamoyladenosine(37)-C(2))-methylthiotransferase MtaB [Thermoanaerobacteraceae bacterium]|nr:tRNA (N(6)-L-threonylcarbamoyladenosine(37)-C(2))-methylthiotransferase MtaB [Thermoanaerobacteraceae bacterium]